MKNKISVPHIESPSLVEVWRWKEESSEELNKMSTEDRIKYLNDKAKNYSNTAYVPDLTKWDLVEGKKKGNFAGFVGFAPVSAPKVEVFVGINNPTDKTGAHGSRHAAPVFREIVDNVLKQMQVAPDKPQK